jgi:medium-chain acyl-[acyl-carrier-protein] hydrolase
MSVNDFSNFYTKQLHVSSFHSDLMGKLSIPSIFSFFQEIAWENATLYGFGYEDLNSHNLFWVLSRLHVEINHLPSWTESFKLATWPSGTDGPFALRDYVMIDKNDEVFARASSSWLILDSATRRPKRPDAFREKMPVCDTTRATVNAPRIDNSVGEIICEKDYKVGVCDIDVNGHINNTKYIEWAINSFSVEDYSKATIKAIIINFLSEGFCDDVCTHRTELIGDRIRKTRITRIADAKNLAVVEIRI